MGVEVVSLGCRLNLSESERLRRELADEDDLVIVNSCAVTAEATRQTRQTIRRLRRQRPHARLLVTGCAVETDRIALSAMSELDGLVPNADKLDGALYRSKAAIGNALSPSAGYTRAYIPVQNGCDHACTFCIIPQGRGPSRSHSIPQVLDEIEEHLAAGAREIVLTGVDITSWGHDLGHDQRLGRLVSAILLAFPALPRLRLSSLDGVEIDPELFALLVGETRVMPHVHLSLQHGHDLILKRMKRRHSRRDALNLVAGLIDRRPDIAIGADLIAGFPTEDEQAHSTNLSLIVQARIVHGHIFPYSPRPGTPAARMPQVPAPMIRERAAQLRAAVTRERNAWLAEQIGKPLKVLAEKDGTGHAENFARVRLGPNITAGTIVTVTPTCLNEGLLA